jgi:hypothetical protein
VFIPAGAVYVLVPEGHVGAGPEMLQVGSGFIFVGEVEAVTAGQPYPSVIVRVYTPAFATETFGIDGFSSSDAKPAGPVHE